MKDIDLDWSPLQYFTFQIFDRLSSPSIKSFEVDCVLDWNHYQYVAYYVSLPGIIFFLSILCHLVFRARNALIEKRKFDTRKVELQEKIISERRKGNDTTKIQESLDEMHSTPDFFTLNHGSAAVLDRVDRHNIDADKNNTQGLTEDDLSKMPATAYDIAFCFSLILFHFSWITIIKHLTLLIRSRSLQDTGAFLLADLRINVQTTVHYAWLVALITFMIAYIGVFPFAMFDRLRGHNDRLHWQSVKSRLGYLFQGLQSRYYWWELLVMTRKLILMVVSTILPEYPLMAAYTSLFVVQGKKNAVCSEFSYESPEHNCVFDPCVVGIFCAANAYSK